MLLFNLGYSGTRQAQRICGEGKSNLRYFSTVGNYVNNYMLNLGIITVRNEIAKVMFLQVSVCPRGVPGPGGCLVLGGCLVPGGAWSPGGGYLVQGVSSRGVSAQGGCLILGGLVSQHALRQTPPPGETATAADGTHPTGMHSCS